jgi:nucleoid-associated protein YgaU
MATSDRYQRLETKVLPDGRTVYKPARPAIVERSITDAIVVGNERDRFDIIARNIYGDAGQWWRLAAINGRVDGSLHVKPGTEIRIPTE